MGEQKIIVREPYYATQCEHCGWHGSSEECGEINYGDDADVTCPACREIIACDLPDKSLHHQFETWDREI